MRLLKKSSPHDISGLEPVIFLSKEAPVMLTINLWTDVRLCNGGTPSVVNLFKCYQSKTPWLPIGIIVKFTNYSSPSSNNDTCIPGHVPICPITETSDIWWCPWGTPITSRTSLGDNNTQEPTADTKLKKAWINHGKSERTSGVSSVATSRLKTLMSCSIKPMPFERLNCLKSKFKAF